MPRIPRAFRVLHLLLVPLLILTSLPASSFAASATPAAVVPPVPAPAAPLLSSPVPAEPPAAQSEAYAVDDPQIADAIAQQEAASSPDGQSPLHALDTAFAKTQQALSTLVLLLRSIAKGETTARLARELGLSRQTVHMLRQRVQDKVNETAVREPLTGTAFEKGSDWPYRCALSPALLPVRR